MARNSHLDTQLLFEHASRKIELTPVQKKHLEQCEECREVLDALRHWSTSSRDRDIEEK